MTCVDTHMFKSIYTASGSRCSCSSSSRIPILDSERSRQTHHASCPHRFSTRRHQEPRDNRVSIKIRPPQSYVAVSSQTVYSGQTPMLARVALTDYWGNVVLDTFVHPTHTVTHYGLISHQYHQQLYTAPSIEVVRDQVVTHIQSKILVGYALWGPLSALNIRHPTIATRDCAAFLPFLRALRATQMPPLPVLVNRFLGRNIGLVEREHPIESARAALDLFRSTEQSWEGLIDQGQWPTSLPPAAYSAFFL